MTAAAPVATDLDRFLEAIWRPGDVREVRMPKGARGTDAGYFDDTSKLASAVTRFDGRENLYITINPAAPALLARAANRIAQGMRTTTSDVDIVERRWLPIDLDPVRPSGISASDDEREHALATARAVYGYLNGLGWPDPVTTMSGNGYWLLYPIELPNDDESKALIESVLKHLSERFSSSAVSIDTTVSNAARIVALIGTMKVKGDATPDRPHRRSTLTFRPSELAPVSREMLEALTPARPVIVVQPLIRVARMPEGWLRDALQQKGIAFRETQRKGRTWYQLQQCPFHPDDDQGGDCGVGEDADGKGLGKCFHNRGVGKGYQDFKAALGLETNVVQLTIVPSRPGSPGPIGMDAADLLDLDLPPLRWIVPDLIPEGTTILAAPPKVGKSCLVYQVAVEASIGGDLLGRRVTPGSVLYLALEDGKRRGQVRLRAVLAGRTMPRGRCEIRWNAPAIGQGLEEEIGAWVEDHPDAVMVAIDTLGKVKPPGSGKGRNAYDVDVEMFTRLHGMFKDTQVGLLIVHHAKKGSEDDFLSKVSGTYGITGSADTTILIERKREDQFGQIHVTGRDVADASIPARFDGLLWLDAPDVSSLRFEGNETYWFLLDSDRPWMPTALAGQLETTPDAMKKRLRTLEGSGLVIRVEGGYTTNTVRLQTKSRNPLSVPPNSPPPKREEREGVDTHTRAHTSAREDTPWMPPMNTTGEWAKPCRDYIHHQSFQRRTDAGWICTKCEEGT